MTEHLVIIGGVAAGAKAAARARRVNPEIKITLVQDEPEVSYTACGQPYYLSGIIADREALIIRKPEDYAREGIEVKTRHKVTHLDTSTQTLAVYDQQNDQSHTIGFDRLILATGARNKALQFPGYQLNGIVTLRSLKELDYFRERLDSLNPQNAVILGSGYIALELAESLSLLGIKVTLIGRNKQLFSKLDPEMSLLIYDYLIEQGITIITGSGILSCSGHDGRVSKVQTITGEHLPADLLVLATGIEPNSELAQQAGIQLGVNNAIMVDETMQTNIKGIYAAGDCAASRHRLTGQSVWAPLGDIANLHGRVAGENAAGGNARFEGVLGTAICKCFELNIGMTGLNEKTAAQAGFNLISIIIKARDKARYFPGAQQFSLKLLAEADTGRILGAQAIGCGQVDKTIDIAATALLGRLTCRDLETADLAYAPPYSPVLSPIIVAAGALSKKLNRQ